MVSILRKEVKECEVYVGRRCDRCEFYVDVTGSEYFEMENFLTYSWGGTANDVFGVGNTYQIDLCPNCAKSLLFPHARRIARDSIPEAPYLSEYRKQLDVLSTPPLAQDIGSTQSLWEAASRTFHGNEIAARKWLFSYSPALLSIPVVLLGTYEGIQLVLSELGKIKEGLAVR